MKNNCLNTSFDFKRRFTLNKSNIIPSNQLQRNKESSQIQNPHRFLCSETPSYQSETRKFSPLKFSKTNFNNFAQFNINKDPSPYRDSSKEMFILGKRESFGQVETFQNDHMKRTNLNFSDNFRPNAKIPSFNSKFTEKFAYKDMNHKAIKGKFQPIRRHNLNNSGTNNPLINLNSSETFNRGGLDWNLGLVLNKNEGTKRNSNSSFLNFMNKSHKLDVGISCQYNSRENSLSQSYDPRKKIPSTFFKEEFPDKIKPTNLFLNTPYLKPLPPHEQNNFEKKLELNFSLPGNNKEEFRPKFELDKSQMTHKITEKNDNLSISKQNDRVSLKSFKKTILFESENSKDYECDLKVDDNQKLSNFQKETTLLEEIVHNFENQLNQENEIDCQNKRLLLIMLKFLYDLDLIEEEFELLNEKRKKIFFQFIIDRYLKDESERDSKIENLYHDISIISDSSTSLSSIEPIKTNNLKKNTNEIKSVEIKINTPKENILNFIDSFYLKDFSKESENCPHLKCKTFELKKNNLKYGNIPITILQDYLRKRERLNLVCRRRKKMHKKSKRNDEKIKKIFKRVMKTLLSRFKQNKLKHLCKKLTSSEREKEFYKFYFDGINIPLDKFYDPLKKKLLNPHFKSISTKYLACLANSQKFIDHLQNFCDKEMVMEVLGKYPEQLLKRFKENPEFFYDMDKHKSKFEWARHELRAAIYHFTFIFEQSKNNFES